jgi:hypothetical protein
MSQRLDRIYEYLAGISNVKVIRPLQEGVDDDIINGLIEIEFQDLNLPFELIIYPQYPYQFHDNETIRFVNRDFIVYDHVNSDGSICIHTMHSPDLERKLAFDFESLKKWIHDYYVVRKEDSHYEHIVVCDIPINGKRMSFWFTEVNYTFKVGEFGFFKYSHLASGMLSKGMAETFLIQGFKVENNYVDCSWSAPYKNLPAIRGAYIYLGHPPVSNRRFIIESWTELEKYVSKAFLEFLYQVKSTDPFENRLPFPIVVGYKISATEIHWQCLATEFNDFPVRIKKSPAFGISSIHVATVPIRWVQTRNCSYSYFFGRGTLDKKLIEGKVLIIGVGAIGSMLATTLTRGGCKNICIIDYDVKEPENVCRSEYIFKTGIVDKVYDLGRTLTSISPFVNIGIEEKFTEYIKAAVNRNSDLEFIKSELVRYDYIFDCSTDNDLAFILDSIKISTQIINLSITNHARELVCAVTPNLYTWMIDIYSRFENTNEDLYNPTGCWSPTFKASYNDIAIMVQFAIRVINQKLSRNGTLRNFYLNYDEEESLLIKIHQF